MRLEAYGVLGDDQRQYAWGEIEAVALVSAVESGREDQVVLMRNGAPVARIVKAEDRLPKRVILGLAKGKCTIPTDEEWAEMDREVARMFDDALKAGELPDAAE